MEKTEYRDFSGTDMHLPLTLKCFLFFNQAAVKAALLHQLSVNPALLYAAARQHADAVGVPDGG